MRGSASLVFQKQTLVFLRDQRLFIVKLLGIRSLLLKALLEVLENLFLFEFSFFHDDRRAFQLLGLTLLLQLGHSLQAQVRVTDRVA